MNFFTKGFFIILLSVFCFLLGADTFAQGSDLGKIQMNFCNNNQKMNEADFVTKAGENFPICIEFANISDKRITVNVEFVDAVVTDDTFKHRACNAPDRAKMQFANFIQGYTHTITLQSGETIKSNYMIKFPIGFEGLSHGCMVYNIVEENQQGNDFLNIIVRSAKFIDMFITATNPIITTHISSTPDIIKKGNKYVIRLGIQNDGNIDENVTIEGTVINVLGYQKEFSFEEIIGADTGKIFETDSFILPFYKGPFLITTHVGYQPQFNFNLVGGQKPLQNIQGGTITKKNIIIVWSSWLMICIGLLVIFIGGKILKKKKT